MMIPDDKDERITYRIAIGMVIVCSIIIVALVVFKVYFKLEQ